MSPGLQLARIMECGLDCVMLHVIEYLLSH